ncbi:IS3 family transposase [Polyangium sp. 6x1]|uniref:IS3 family transposase n=1 Tax=Polyangium sp. 6x1 TaxID=3042689 RepID=UPI002482633E|nr:IS3 family transposase [Polyangium sp. 6x1]MDI1450815.1 IS3 family transposase [Polyangium sp. 6x1]
MAKRKRRSFSAEFKAEAVRLCQVGDRSITKVAQDLDLTETALREWLRAAEVSVGETPPEALTSAERDELVRLRREVKRLQMEREILKKAAAFLREGERVKFAFIAVEKAYFPVSVLCDVLGVSRSGFYAWSKRPEPRRKASDAQLAAEITAAHRRSRGTYGSPRVHAELRAKGLCVSRKRVERLMRERGLEARRKRRFRRTTDSNHTMPIAPNVLGRRFDAKAPNEAWVTDVTYIPTAEGWLYLAAILDLFSRRVVGFAMSEQNDRALALAALERALRARRPASGMVHHSDRGSPYASEAYREALRERGIVASMSRTGDCYDNAVAESFFATLKAELVDGKSSPTRDAAMASIGDYLERFYNHARRHSYLGYLSPVEFELRAQVATFAA